MNTTAPKKENDEFQIAPSLVDFLVDDVETREGFVEFNLIYKHDSDNHVTVLMKTVNKTGEYAYQPDDSNDPQDEQSFDYEYPEIEGFAVVTDYNGVSVRKTQLIMLTCEQEAFVNLIMRENAAENVPNLMAKAKENALIAKAEMMID